MNLVKRLKDTFPELYIQGFHGTKEYGLWGFRGFDQHEAYWEQCPYDAGTIYPDLSEDRLTASGMRFQSWWNQNFRFMPAVINHSLAPVSYTHLDVYKRQIYWRILLPLCKPILMTLGASYFISNWNNYMWPVIIINDPDKYVIQMTIAGFSQEHSTAWNLIFAGTVICSVPIFLLFSYFQKYIVEGIKTTGIKS